MEGARVQELLEERTDIRIDSRVPTAALILPGAAGIRSCNRIHQNRTTSRPTQMHALRRRLLVLAAALVAGTMPAQTTTLFSDDLSSISNWVYFNSTSVRVSGGKLLIDDGQHAIAFFSASGGGRQTVGLNESLQVSFTLSFSNPIASPTGMRMGLFDSNAGTIPPANTPTTSSSVFQGYDGFLFSWDAVPPSGNNTLTLRYRTPAGQSGNAASTSLMSSFTNTYSTVGVTAGTAPPLTTFQAGVDYQATYTISRGSTNTLTFAFSVTGGSIATFSQSSSVSAPSTYEFNAFALYSLSNTSDFAIDNVLITHTTPVPEPSTYAACAGAAVLGLAFWRRRRAAAKALAA
jgi:hypothetical protein